MNTWIASLLSRRPRAAMPILTSPGIALIGKTPMEVFRSGELQYQTIHALAKRFPMAAALTMMDLSVEAEAFGAPVKFSDKENPNVASPIVHQRDDVDRLVVPAVGAARTAECLHAAKRSAAEITDRPTLGGLIGPLSLAGRLIDVSRVMLLAAMEPETVHALLEKTTAFLIEYARAFKAAGCGGLIMAEPAAGLVSPAMCQQFSSDYIRRIVEAVAGDDFAFVLHNCGKTEKQVTSMLSTGASAIHVGNAVDITKILEQVPPHIPVCGNIDPAGVFLAGTPDDVATATRNILAATESYPHFVISSGCDIPPMTPLANVDAFFKTLAETR
ncbi:MAG: uroporphyrinogen decarboxylase family protein [Thermoguttaceae bacterium]